jgi:hypothetical protein
MLLKANTWYYYEGPFFKQSVCWPVDTPVSSDDWVEIHPPTISPVKRTLASYDLKTGMKVMLDKLPNPYTVVAIFDGKVVFGCEGLPLIVAGFNDFWNLEILPEDPPKQLTVAESLTSEHLGKMGRWKNRAGDTVEATLICASEPGDFSVYLSACDEGNIYTPKGRFDYSLSDRDLVVFLGWL